MEKMMKEVVVVSPHNVEIRTVPVPQITGDYDVLVKMQSAGVCGSDFHIYNGTNPCSTYPRIPGHENAGIVAAVGSKVSKVKIGDHIIVDLISTCGHCYQCKIGRKNVCANVKVRGSGADGGWREYFIAPENEVYKISKDVPWEDAALTEPFAIGAHCTNRGRVVPDDTVLIFGLGTIGAIILQNCKAKKCKNIICCDVNDAALERAKKYGATHVINTKKENLIEAVQRITNGQGVTIAFDSAAFPGSLTIVMQPGIVCNAGRIVPMGFSTEPEAISQAMINQREVDIIGSRMSCFQFEPTIKHLENHDFILDGIATNFIKFSNIQEVFEHIAHPNPAIKKMVILFD